MKAAILAILPVLVLAGCQHALTLEQAQEQCMKKGGMLMLIYTQEITNSGPGPQIVSPGNCILANNFDNPPNPPGGPPGGPPTNPPAQ